MPSIGERIHRIRLHIGWSVEECAYRATIEANAHIEPSMWLDWERCCDEQAGREARPDQVSNRSNSNSVVRPTKVNVDAHGAASAGVPAADHSSTGCVVRGAAVHAARWPPR